MGWGQHTSFTKLMIQRYQDVGSCYPANPETCLFYEIKKIPASNSHMHSGERTGYFLRSPLQCNAVISDKYEFPRWFPGGSQKAVGLSSKEVAKHKAGPLQSLEFHQLYGSNCP